jgi:hypothetical protein
MEVEGTILYDSNYEGGLRRVAEFPAPYAWKLRVVNANSLSCVLRFL